MRRKGKQKPGWSDSASLTVGGPRIVRRGTGDGQTGKCGGRYSEVKKKQRSIEKVTKSGSMVRCGERRVCTAGGEERERGTSNRITTASTKIVLCEGEPGGKLIKKYNVAQRLFGE